MNRTMMPMMALAVFFCGVATGVAEALEQKTERKFKIELIPNGVTKDIQYTGQRVELKF